MKMYKVLFLCCIFSMLLLSWFDISNVEAAKSLWPRAGGELCWQRSGDGTILKVYVTPVGNNYYSVYYYEKNEEEVYLQMSSGGSAYVDTNQIIMSIHYTYNGSSNLALPPTDADVYGCQFILDKETLNGKGWCNGIVYEEPDYYELKHSEGQLTYTACL